MLEFTTEPLSGQLVAHSEKCAFTSYWINEGAWTHLQTSTLTYKGPIITKPEPFYSVEDAIEAAQKIEDEK